jgi:predicted MFS family arabinose efflux permease
MLWSNAFFLLTIIGVITLIAVVAWVKVDELHESKKNQRLTSN